MKLTDLVTTVAIHLFLGYLWILFANHVFIDMNASVFLQIVLGGAGTFLFGMIFNRITPFAEMKLSNPVRVVGMVAFASVIVVHVFVVSLV
ncbi:hypothetical protein FLK61_26530 [Paenalkalicoccus suaedae]|uniref:Uncharacterized protein n=1 Tax=Paenalkalicoccus suaedae TaxID=2592382 RepID=A0A859FBW6_9BACI|nr:hypothetical protein [Paenalkalicoccus suaedae]QKS70318.1 hypothetical protein FLK61_26530 [Paenalkalicoccus suaedae]